MDFASDPNTWDAMTWDAAAKDIQQNGPTGQAFEVVARWAENQGFMGNKPEDLTNMAVSQSVTKQPPAAQPTPWENIKNLFRNPNKNPYPGRTAPGRNAGEIFGNAMEQR